MFRGSAGLAGFFRRPYGFGWALVGDAGYHKNPITARGITDAFRDAELLAGAIDDTFSGRRSANDAFPEYERNRNEAAMPMYEFDLRPGETGAAAPGDAEPFAAMRDNEEQSSRFLGTIAGTVRSPSSFPRRTSGRSSPPPAPA